MTNITTFILAGKATFTLQGKEARFTYRVSRKEAEPGSRYGNAPTYFVGLLSGPDNTADYRYVGILDTATGYVRLTRNSKLAPSAPSVKALHWALPKVWAGAAMPPSFSIHHEGRCGRCGRELTVPESVETGIGPDCAEQMGIAQVTKAEAQALAQKRNGIAQVRERHAEPAAGCEPGYELFATAFEEVR
jgi:hypothetical protein